MDEPSELLAVVTDTQGVEWTRYHTDPFGGRHWWSFLNGWAAFVDIEDPTTDENNEE